MSQQHTLAGPVEVEGVGLHSGCRGHVRLEPAAPGTGRRVWGDGASRPVCVNVAHVRDTSYATTIGGAGWRVATVEHLLAALAGEGVDDVEIRVSGPEVPVLDGSARPWSDAIARVGLTAQPLARRQLVMLRPVKVTDGPRWASLAPCDSLELCAEVDFPHPAVGHQRGDVRLASAADFRRELAWARTFGFLSELEAMQRAGLIQGGTLESAVVFGPDGPLNPGGLRAPDEVVRHKLLDMLGDLALLGCPVRARFEALRPGHGLTRQLLQALAAQPDAWTLVPDTRAPGDASGWASDRPA